MRISAPGAWPLKLWVFVARGDTLFGGLAPKF